MSEDVPIRQYERRESPKTEKLLNVDYAIPIEEVLKLISFKPSGPIGSLGLLRINEKKLFNPEEDVRKNQTQQINRFQEQVQRRVDVVRGHLSRLLKNPVFLERILSKNISSLTFEELQSITGMKDGYEHTVARMHMVLTRSIDPEIIPLLVASTTQNEAMAEKLASIFDSNYNLILSFTKIITDPEFMDKFIKSKDFDGYPADIDEKITEFINKMCQLYTRQYPDEDESEIRSYYRDFFNLNGDRHPKESETGMELMGSVKQTTVRYYFETRYQNQAGSFTDWQGLEYYEDKIQELFQKYAQDYYRATYFVGLYKKIEQLFKEIFPMLYLPPGVKKLEIARSTEIRKDKNTNEYCAVSNGYWRIGENQLGIYSATDLESFFPEDLQTEVSRDFSGIEGRRAIIDANIIFHEIAHAIYDARIGKTKRDEDYRKTADHAINEGQAFLLEMIFSDYLISNAESMGLSGADIKYIRESKLGRIYSLKEGKNVYGEGTIKILHKIFVQGAGRGKNRDVSSGLRALKDFLSNLDLEKTLAVKRDSQEYLAALKKGDPKIWREMFEKS